MAGKIQLKIDAADPLTGENTGEFPDVDELKQILRGNNKHINTQINQHEAATRALNSTDKFFNKDKAKDIADTAVNIIGDKIGENDDILANVAISEDELSNGQDRQRQIALERETGETGMVDQKKIKDMIAARRKRR